jgi:thioredoxin 1
MYGPIYEQVGEEQDIKLLKIDVDKEGALASEVGVMGVPTTIMYKQGKPVDRFSGLAPKDQLLDFINKNK